MVRAWGDLRGNKRPLVQTMYGRICGSICLMHRKLKQNKDGLSKNQSSTNARQLRGILFIEPNDEKFKLTMKAARRKLEVPMPVAMPCKTPINSRGETCRSIEKSKTKYACIVDADETMRVRLDGAVHKPHQDHITARGMTSLNHCSLVHKFIPMPQALKNTESQGSSGKI